MDFRILGSLEVLQEGRALPSLPYKPRALLGLLLLHRGQAVSVDRLMDDLWGEQPPATAAKSLHIYVSQLRKALGDDVLETRKRGYALVAGAEQVDAARFERMLQQGIEELGRGRAREAAAVLAEALALWRGPALADFAYEPWAQAEIGRLEALRLAAVEERIDADLALGRHGTLIAELEGLVDEHPTRERACGQLMLALYRSGRQAEALEVFRERRHRIVDELGIEPGPALRELEAAILRQDPGLEAPVRRSSGLLPRRRPGRRPIALGAAAVLVAGVAAAVSLDGEDEAPALPLVAALPSSICSALAYEPGTRPTRLIISDQDLGGDNRVLGSQVTAAVEFVLRERRFTAGPYRLAFQACDSQTHDSEGAIGCAEKASRYAAHPALLGVVGPLVSRCASDVIPAANEAPAGPLAVVSSSTTRVGLTRRDPDAHPSEPGRYYPTGVRNFVRVIAADDFLVAAGAMLARQLGVKRPFVIVEDEYGFAAGRGKAEVFRTAAEKLGLDVAGSIEWEPDDHQSVLGRIRRSRADGVFLPGGDADVVRGVRAAFGPDFPILTTDAFSSPDVAKSVGPASEGLRFTASGVDPRGVTGARRELIDRLRQAVGEPHPYAVSAVQATELLLDAIARSDGTRRSVISELFASEVRGGVLGDFSVTPAGDTTANQVTVYRIVNGAPRFDRILNPPLSLVASIR